MIINKMIRERLKTQEITRKKFDNVFKNLDIDDWKPLIDIEFIYREKSLETYDLDTLLGWLNSILSTPIEKSKTNKKEVIDILDEIVEIIKEKDHMKYNIREQLKGYTLNKKILDERLKGKKFKTDTGAGTFFCYDALYYGNDCISPDEYKLHELVDWIKTLLGTGPNVHHPILYHINKEKAVEVVNEIIEIIKEKEEKSKICKEPEYMVESSKGCPFIDEMKKQEKENMKKQKATLKLADGREIEVEISEDELKKLAVKKNPFERVKAGEKYFTYDRRGFVGGYIDNYRTIEDCIFETLNYYNDEEFAKKCARADLLMRKLRKFAVENNEKSYSNVYLITYHKDVKKLRFFESSSREHFAGEVFFSDSNICQKAIETFHDELIWYFTEYLKIYE